MMDLIYVVAARVVLGAILGGLALAAYVVLMLALSNPSGAGMVLLFLVASYALGWVVSDI